MTTCTICGLHEENAIDAIMGDRTICVRMLAAELRRIKQAALDG